MPADVAASGRVVAAGRECSLTKAVLEEWSCRGTPRQVEYLASFLEAERSSREASKRAMLLRRCSLPAPKTFEGYDWSWENLACRLPRIPPVACRLPRVRQHNGET